MAEQQDNWSWRKATPVLSLDVIRPFFDPMGLRPPNASEFQNLLRHRLVALRPAKSSGVPPPDPDAWVADLKSRLRARFGVDFIQNFDKWMHTVLFPRGDVPYNAWRLLLSDACRTPETWRELGFSGPSAESLRQRYIAVTNWRPLELLAQSAKSSKLSEWDLALYALYDFYDEANDPVDDGIAAAKRQAIFTFWREMERSTTAEERSRTLINAQRIAKRKRMTLTSLLDSSGWPQW